MYEKWLFLGKRKLSLFFYKHRQLKSWRHPQHCWRPTPESTVPADNTDQTPCERAGALSGAIPWLTAGANHAPQHLSQPQLNEGWRAGRFGGGVGGGEAKGGGQRLTFLTVTENALLQAPHSSTSSSAVHFLVFTLVVVIWDKSDWACYIMCTAFLRLPSLHQCK